MVRKFFIAGIIISVIAIVVFFRYAELVSDYRNHVPSAESPLVPQQVINEVYYSQAAFFTASAAIAGFIYFFYHMALYIFSVWKGWTIKPAFSVLLIAIAVIMCSWNFLMYFSPSHISFDEVYIAWLAGTMLFIAADFISIKRMNNRKNIINDPDVLDSGMHA